MTEGLVSGCLETWNRIIVNYITDKVAVMYVVQYGQSVSQGNMTLPSYWDLCYQTFIILTLMAAIY
jgi:nucleoside recognition membrane protein YjiH